MRLTPHKDDKLKYAENTPFQADPDRYYLTLFKIRHNKNRDFSVFKACRVRLLSAYTPLADQIIFQFVVIKYNIIFCTSKIRS